MDYINTERVRDRYDVVNIIEDYQNGVLQEGDEVDIKGYIHRIRAMSGFAFVILRSPRALFQCVWAEEDEPKFAITDIEEEDCVIAHGRIVKDERSSIGFEVRLLSITKLSHPAEKLPFAINKKRLDCNLDVLLDHRVITLRNPRERAILKVADGVLTAFRNFMHEEGFTEFVAPKIVSAGAEGGADMFELDYFGRKAYLSQSPQMYKQMMVGVFQKVFTTSPVFRAEKHSTSRHINEFQGMDFEMGFIDSFEDIMAVECRLMKYLFAYLNENYRQELEEFKVYPLPEINEIPKIRFHELKELIATTYKRPYRDQNDLEPEEEKLIGKYFLEKYNSPFVFVTHYPSKKRPFYAMDDPENPEVTLSFDLIFNGTEITTGGQRIHDYEEQVAKMQARGMDIADFEDYLSMHKYGMPPHGGLGLGMERVVMRILNIENVKQATAFPRDTQRLNP